MVLGTIREAIKQEVNPQEEKSPRHICRLVHTAGLLRAAVLLTRGVERKDGYAGCDGQDDEVLVQREASAEDGDVEEHDGEELAALGEEEGDVVNVCEAGVSEWAGEAARDGHEG